MMPKRVIAIGDTLKGITIHNQFVSGEVESILINTVVLRDNNGDTRLLSKKMIEKNGISFDTANVKASIRWYTPLG